MWGERGALGIHLLAKGMLAWKSLGTTDLHSNIDGSRCPITPSIAAAIYDPGTSISKMWKLPRKTDITTAEMFAFHQALIYLNTKYTISKAVIYTDSKSSLYLLSCQLHPPHPWCTPFKEDYFPFNHWDGESLSSGCLPIQTSTATILSILPPRWHSQR